MQERIGKNESVQELPFILQSKKCASERRLDHMIESAMGTRIAERRRHLGVTQAEMARRIGISPSYLNLIERNKRRITGALLLKAAQALGLKPEDMDGATERRLAETLRETAHLPDCRPRGRAVYGSSLYPTIEPGPEHAWHLRGLLQ